MVGSMTTTRHRRASAIGALVLGALAASALTGCSAELTREEAQASDHKVIEVGNKFWSGKEWAYKGSDGKKVPLSKNCAEGAFSQSCKGSKDGLIQFRYSTTKYGIDSESITIDGVKWKADCTQRSDFAGGDYVCAPLADAGKK